jgi:hypothetical protein
MCNCKGGKKRIINNLDSPDHIKNAEEVYNRVILGKDISTFNELDIIEIMEAYKSLYPNSSATPSVESAINEIKTGIEVYNVKYSRKR